MFMGLNTGNRNDNLSKKRNQKNKRNLRPIRSSMVRVRWQPVSIAKNIKKVIPQKPEATKHVTWQPRKPRTSW